MILGILRFVHVVFGLIAIGAGVLVLYGMFLGRLLNKGVVIFLKCALAVSVTGLLFPFHSFLPTHWAAMLGIYLSGMAVLAWRKFHLAGGWSLVFALSIIILLCLNIAVSIAHIFRFMPIFKTLAPTQSKLLFFVSELIAMLPFAGLCIFAFKRFRKRSINSLLP